MKVKDLQEARLAQTTQYEIVAEFLEAGLLSMGDPYEHFSGLADNLDTEGGLNKAIAYIQRWNVAVEFVKQHTPDTILGPISKSELDEWIQTWRDT